MNAWAASFEGHSMTILSAGSSAPRDTMTGDRRKHAHYECNDGCPVEAALEEIGGKWKGVALYHLCDGPIRFSELRRQMGAATPRVLTKQLRELEADGIVHREVYAVVPPKVEYSLTEKGEALRGTIAALREWGLEFAMPE